MNWTDEGIVLSARKHGESAAIVTLLTVKTVGILDLFGAGTARGHAVSTRPGIWSVPTGAPV